MVKRIKGKHAWLRCFIFTPVCEEVMGVSMSSWLLPLACLGMILAFLLLIRVVLKIEADKALHLRAAKRQFIKTSLEKLVDKTNALSRWVDSNSQKEILEKYESILNKLELTITYAIQAHGASRGTEDLDAAIHLVNDLFKQINGFETHLGRREG